LGTGAAVAQSAGSTHRSGAARLCDAPACRHLWRADRPGYGAQAHDIRWHEQTIAFAPSKGGKPLKFPLDKSVAEALLAYLRRDRGTAPFDEVFLTIRGARRPLGLNNHLWAALKIYYQRAGIRASVIGTHAIRHAVATRLLERGASIKTIADLLGHRHIETTYIYTKVDLTQLRTLAGQWPEVRS
jgi:integrase/recombinase XerD